MARITVEDCIDKFPSRFELVLVASNRARKLYSGENPTVEKDNDKNTVIALREIASETLTTDELKNNLIEEYQTNFITDDEELTNEQDENEDVNDKLIETETLEAVEQSSEGNIVDQNISEDEDNNNKTGEKYTEISEENNDVVEKK
tara:strand:- start:1615 stop:2055 length:441 start_codon:yes stop_codon:yes gene_type:complete